MFEKNQNNFYKRKRMKVFVNGCEFKNWKILDGYLYIKCGFGYTLANALVESGYVVEIKEND